MNYYLAGYYLIKLRPLGFGNFLSKSIYTCSTCINDSLLDSFSRSWTVRNDDIQVIENDLQGNSQMIGQIQEWTEKKDLEDKTGFLEVFYDINTAKEYHNAFFPNTENVKLFGLYLPESEAEELIKEFEPQNDKEGEIGIVHKLKSREIPINDKNIIGYDLIGVEIGGGFHSFHCHDLYADLNKEFGAKLNNYGLLGDDSSWRELSDYMNDEDNGFEPVPWYFAQVRLIE